MTVEANLAELTDWRKKVDVHLESIGKRNNTGIDCFVSIALCNKIITPATLCINNTSYAL